MPAACAASPQPASDWLARGGVNLSSVDLWMQLELGHANLIARQQGVRTICTAKVQMKRAQGSFV